ncbi:MAG: hypothetical protein IKM99_01080 [Bacteroidales bacterium]|nr:hypothetical protein [Bacteroidales bacterium]
MKNTFRCLIVLALALSVSFAEAQVIGKERPVLEKNIYIGFKGGVTAMDMRYKNEKGDSFVNHTALYQSFGNIKGCLAGGVFVERTLPGWSYGIEFNFNMVNAISRPDKPHYVLQDSAYLANIRIPVKAIFLDDYLFSPYVFAAPEIGTYVSDTTFVTSQSIINGEVVQWGTKNARSLNLNIVAGVGVDAKIQIGLYEFKARFEAGYRLGLLNTMAKEIPFERKTRGWEATIGFAFPLFVNPSYAWFN